VIRCDQSLVLVGAVMVTEIVPSRGTIRRITPE
jgi:hypothetical protein